LCRLRNTSQRKTKQQRDNFIFFNHFYANNFNLLFLLQLEN